MLCEETFYNSDLEINIKGYIGGKQNVWFIGKK